MTVCRAFTSEDQLRVKLGPRTRRQGKQQANHSSKEHRTLTTDPHDQKREQGGEERVQKGREPKSTSESIAPFTHSNPD